MIIGIDGNEANVEKKVGIGEYSFEILKNFEESHMPNVKFQIYLKDKPRNDMPREREGWKYIVVKPRKFWTQTGLPFYLFTHSPRPDVFFSPSHYAPRFSPAKTAIAIMDVSYLHFPELFAKKDLYQLISWTKYSAKHAKKVFTISNSSKNDILKAYEKDPEDVVVTYPGLRLEMQHMSLDMTKEQLQKKYNISGNYVLFVGTLQPRKNITRLIEAFAKVKKEAKQKDLELVIVGKKGWLYEEILQAPKKFDIKERVLFLDFVTDEDLPSLYSNAEVFVLPSLYEGFGLPVLEAMKYGCPVITSNVSSLPEAGGEAALYIDPTNVKQMTGMIEKVLEDKSLREDMIKKGYEHVKKFSWEKTAKKTLEILEEVAKKG